MCVCVCVCVCARCRVVILFLPCSYETMDKANSRFRIMLMFGMMSFCVLGSVAAIRTGKENVRSHEGSLYTKNRDRYAGENNR